MIRRVWSEGRVRRQAALVLLAPALAAVGGGHPALALTLAALGAVAALAAADVVVVPVISVAASPVGRHRAWTRTEARIVRAEEPDRPGRPRPRAPGAERSRPEP